jgi:hypothetical protein
MLVVLRHEDMRDRVVACRRQFHALGRHLLAEEAIGDLHQQTRAVSHQGIRTHGAAMGQVLEHRQPVENGLMRPDVLHVGDEAHAARVMLVARVVQTDGGHALGRSNDRFRRRGARCGRHGWRHLPHGLYPPFRTPRGGGQSVVRAASGEAIPVVHGKSLERPGRPCRLSRLRRNSLDVGTAAPAPTTAPGCFRTPSIIGSVRMRATAN